MFVLVVFAVLSAAWVLFAVLLSTTPIHTMNASAVAALAEADDVVAFATFDVASGGLTGIGNSTNGSIPYSKDGTAMGLSKLTNKELDQETIFQYRSVRSHVCFRTCAHYLDWRVLALFIRSPSLQNKRPPGSYCVVLTLNHVPLQPFNLFPARHTRAPPKADGPDGSWVQCSGYQSVKLFSCPKGGQACEPGSGNFNAGEKRRGEKRREEERRKERRRESGQGGEVL